MNPYTPLIDSTAHQLLLLYETYGEHSADCYFKAHSFCSATSLLMDIQHALATTGPSKATVLIQSSRHHAAQPHHIKKDMYYRFRLAPKILGKGLKELPSQMPVTTLG